MTGGPSAERPEETKSPAQQGEPSPSENPNGPRAKTAELRLPGAAAEASEPPARATAPEVKASTDESVVTLADPIDETAEVRTADAEPEGIAAQTVAAEAGVAVAQNGSPDTGAASSEEPGGAPCDDLGELFGRVMGLSLTLKYPAFQCALEGFADKGRVYLVYSEEKLTPLSRRPGGIKMREG